MHYKYKPWPIEQGADKEMIFAKSNIEIISGQIDLSKMQEYLVRKD